MFGSQVVEVPGTQVQARLDSLGDELAAVASQIAQLQARQGELIRQIDACGGLEMTLRQFVAYRAGLVPTEASRAVRVAQSLDALPALADAFEAGALSEGTVAVLTPVATAANEASLLETTRLATGAQLVRLARSYRRVVDHDRAPNLDETMHAGIDEAGMWRLTARLSPERGAIVDAALDAAAQREHQASGELLSGPDTLLAMANDSLEVEVSAAGVLAERYHTIVHLEPHSHAHLVEGTPIDEPTLAELCCESWMTLVHRDGDDITVTSPTRAATPAQRRALLVRDGGCRFPGCGRVRHLKAHHIIHHANGGPTRLDNLVLLCGTHHRLIHRHGWQLVGDPHGELLFIDPFGRERNRPPDRRPPPEPPPAPTPLHRGQGEHFTTDATDTTLRHWLNGHDDAA